MRLSSVATAFLCVVCIPLVTAKVASAQGAESTVTDSVSASARLSAMGRPARFGMWFAGGWHAPISNYSPLRTDREVLLIGVEGRYRLVTTRWVQLSTAPSLLPAVYTTGNRRQDNVRCRDVFAKNCEFGSAYSAYAVGLLPASVRAEAFAARRVGLSASADAGGAFFNQRVPATKATRFNFVARFGADVVLRAANDTWVSLGYRHLHLSNGGTGDINPGIDTPLWAFGVAWR